MVQVKTSAMRLFYYKKLVMKRKGGVLLYMLILLAPNLVQTLYAQEREQGYQGYVEAGYTIGTTDWREANRIELSTSHGYQFHRPFFVGIGVGYSSYFEDTDSPLRMYVIRFNKHR